MDEQERKDTIANIALALEALSPSKLALVKAMVAKLSATIAEYRNPKSDFISATALTHIGDALLVHHSMSQRPLSKESFEHALESALLKAKHAAKLSKRGNPGHDITVDEVPISLKTQADTAIKPDILHISKYMELGSGKWELPLLLNQYLAHMKNYKRVFQFRCHRQDGTKFLYELVEIPMSLLQEGASATLEVMEDSKQTPKPGYGHVHDKAGKLKFSLYFDGGTERKLQVKSLRKELCTVHATWSLDSATLA